MKQIIKKFIIMLALALCAQGCAKKNEGITISKPLSLDANKPHFKITKQDLATPATIGTNYNSETHLPIEIYVRLHLTNARSEDFRKFTQDHLHQQIQLLGGSTVVAEPVIETQISDAEADIAFPSFDDAQAVVNSLNKQ